MKQPKPPPKLASERQHFTSHFACTMNIYGLSDCQILQSYLYDVILIYPEEKELSFLMCEHELPVNVVIYCHCVTNTTNVLV